VSAPEPSERVYIGTDGSGSLDDAIGPAVEAHRLMERIVGDRGGEVHTPDEPQDFTGLLALWRDKLKKGLLSGRTGLCPHLWADTAQIMIWFVYLPDMIRCRICAERAADSVHGTPDDDICDGCGKTVIGPYMHTRTGEITAQVRKGRTTGPVLIHGGACPECNQKDKTYITGPVRVRRVGKRED